MQSELQFPDWKTNDEQLCNVLLGHHDRDPAGPGWGPGNFGSPTFGERPRQLLPPPTFSPLQPLAGANILSEPVPRYEPLGFPMADADFEPIPGASFFDIYPDGGVIGVAPSLPEGQCNYRDLGPGAYGARCGCRRFWSRATAPRTLNEAIAGDQALFCMCNHHACFHESCGGTKAQTGDGISAVDHAKPRTGRDPLSPLQDVSLYLPPALPPPVESPTVANAGTTAFTLGRLDAGEPGTPDRPSLGADASLPDTLSWGDVLQSQGGQKYTSTLPPIPSQCLLPSRPSSVAESSQSRYMKPFAGRGLQTLSGARASKLRPALQDKQQDGGSIVQRLSQGGVGDDYFSTRVPYGSHADSQASRGSDGGDTQTISPYSGPSREAFKNLSDVVNGHEQRIDRLENVSFSAAGHDECHEKFDHTDLRVTELESRVEEVERLVNDSASHCTSRANRADNFDISTCSVVSGESSATYRGLLDSGEVFTRLRSLQSQVDKLQASMPSADYTWDVEVVFLPFPLRRVWQESKEFKGEPAHGPDGWTQMPNTCSTSTLRSHSPAPGEWAGDGEYEWLQAKAFGVKSIIDRRLRSRGLVKTISVKGSDARSVQSAMATAFGGLLRDLASVSSQRSRRRSTTRSGQYLGLLHDWVPLRKVHKDSRLRFLSPDEMVTPATWNVQFLHSVVMKSSEPRLFVTQPEAYIQDKNAYHSGWTWQSLRELDRVYPDSQDSGEVPEGDAKEECWSWNEQYDDPTKLPAPLKLGQSRTGLSSSPSQQFYTGVESPIRSSSPYISGIVSPVKARKKPQPLHIRTTSMPPSLPQPFSPSQDRRRIVSYGQEQPQVTGQKQPQNVGSHEAPPNKVTQPSTLHATVEYQVAQPHASSKYAQHDTVQLRYTLQQCTNGAQSQ